jgi:hypothetical protein
MNAARYSPIEQEIIVLKASWELIGEMVNYEMFVRPDKVTDVTLFPSTRTHQRLFNILLVDFLTAFDAASFDLPLPEVGGQLSDKTYLFYLKRIATKPLLNSDSPRLLADPVIAFSDWLDKDCTIERVWLPSIEVQTDITLKRIQFLRICGVAAKHHFMSMTRNAKDISAILKLNGVEMTRDQQYLVIPDFYEWFHGNILNYHIGAIAEFLNNIRWGIFEYLRPEFLRSFTKYGPDFIDYKYLYPAGVESELARTMYWDLMNEVMSKPYMQKFEITRYLKMRY